MPPRLLGGWFAQAKVVHNCWASRNNPPGHKWAKTGELTDRESGITPGTRPGTMVFMSGEVWESGHLAWAGLGLWGFWGPVLWVCGWGRAPQDTSPPDTWAHPHHRPIMQPEQTEANTATRTRKKRPLLTERPSLLSPDKTSHHTHY